jgi:hypothetical protein
MELAVVRFEGVSSCQQARSRTIPVALRIVHDAPCSPRHGLIREGCVVAPEAAVQDCTPGKKSDAVDNYRLTKPLTVKAIFSAAPRARNAA